MKYQKFGDVFAVRVDRGEEIVASLRSVCLRENIRFASVSGIGAVGHTVLGLYHVEGRRFDTTVFDGEMEMTGLSGNVTESGGEPYLHLHASFAGPGGKAVGGHLVEGIISGTSEIFLRAIDGTLEHRPDPRTGLNVWEMEREEIRHDKAYGSVDSESGQKG